MLFRDPRVYQRAPSLKPLVHQRDYGKAFGGCGPPSHKGQGGFVINLLFQLWVIKSHHTVYRSSTEILSRDMLQWGGMARLRLLTLDHQSPLRTMTFHSSPLVLLTRPLFRYRYLPYLSRFCTIQVIGSTICSYIDFSYMVFVYSIDQNIVFSLFTGTLMYASSDVWEALATRTKCRPHVRQDLVRAHWIIK